VGCDGTDVLEPLEGIVGQERALRALEFGLGIRDPRFNIYVAGQHGTGRSTAVNEFLAKAALTKPVPRDWCYVHNFRDSYQPSAIPLPPGKGGRFARDMATLVDALRREIPRAFESEAFAQAREQVLHSFGRKREGFLSALGELAAREGFALQSGPAGLVLTPLVGGRPMTAEEFSRLPEQQKDALHAKQEALGSELMETLREVRRVERDARSAVEELSRKTAMATVSHLFEHLRGEYSDVPEVLKYLGEVLDDVLDNLPAFREADQEKQPAPASVWVREAPFRRYAANPVVDNSDLKGAPVVMELNPTYQNLFGRIEKEAQMGALLTDLTLVRAGALHRANGGYLVLPVEQLLTNPLSYDGLKRALTSHQIAIEEAGERLGMMVTKTLRPQPVPLDLKVILIGTPDIYQKLYALDPDFSELFKVKAEFDTMMDRTVANIRNYALLLCKLCKKENLRHLTADAICKVIEYSSRLAEDQTKLSTRFAEIADVVREAGYYAAQDGAGRTDGAHIAGAIEAKAYRSNLIETRLRELVARGMIKIATRGTATGEINALSVLDAGDFAFGRPSRITASVGPGREGIIDIERSVLLGGPLHSKGVLILGGYLTHRFARRIPLSLDARLVFEQSYCIIDGDSASSAEIYAMLSALSGIPLKRGIAVTGSVNQWGEVQAIGGVNEKIEGFFEICKIDGLTGDQGVVIPASNQRSLALKEHLVETVREGGFHIWAVSTIDEGIELLTGVPAGKETSGGGFPEGTVNYKVQERLHELAEKMREYADLR
jgi:predicted ATP-dependent protease